MSLEYLIVGIYLLVLVVTGVVFSRFSRTASDYVRAGAQGAWWLLGTSIIMAAISAFTFTGNGSAAYSAGPTFLVIYLANVIALVIGGSFLAGWFRQTRAHTTMDVVRARFGTAVEQFAVAEGGKGGSAAQDQHCRNSLWRRGSMGAGRAGSQRPCILAQSAAFRHL